MLLARKQGEEGGVRPFVPSQHPLSLGYGNQQVGGSSEKGRNYARNTQHVTQSIAGMGGICVSQLSNRFDWSPRVRSIQDAVGSRTPRVACRLGSYRTGPDPCPTWDTEAQAKMLSFCTPHSRAQDPHDFPRVNDGQ